MSIYATRCTISPRLSRIASADEKKFRGKRIRETASGISDSLLGGEFLMKALRADQGPHGVPTGLPQDERTWAIECFPAKIVQSRRMEGIRPALEEMRDFLTMPATSNRRRGESCPRRFLRVSYYFRPSSGSGSIQVRACGMKPTRVAQIRGIQVSMLDEADRGSRGAPPVKR